MKLLRALIWKNCILLSFIPNLVFASEQAIKQGESYRPLAAAFAIGLAALGGGIGQGLTAGAALIAIGRNPGARDKIFTPMIIGLALIESLVLYGFVIAFNFTS